MLLGIMGNLQKNAKRFVGMNDAWRPFDEKDMKQSGRIDFSEKYSRVYREACRQDDCLEAYGVGGVVFMASATPLTPGTASTD